MPVDLKFCNFAYQNVMTMTKAELTEKLQNVTDDAIIRIATANGVYDIESVASISGMVNIVAPD